MNRSLSRIAQLLAFTCPLLLVAAPARSETPPHAAVASAARQPAQSDSVVSPLPDWSVVATTLMFLGISVDSAGDVNGDGYDDVLVGAPLYQLSFVGGAAMVYHGSASGPSTTPDWLRTGYGPSGEFGEHVAGAGDVNGDGYDDVLVSDDYVDPGRVSLYYGSASGLSVTAAWTGSGPISPPTIAFGRSIDSAGDVNGDGYDDVIVGDPFYDADYALGGAAFVYYGSETGLNLVPDWEFRSPITEARLGWSVSAAGDVNDDGFGDLLVGAPMYPVGTGRYGYVYVFHGSASGLAATPSRILYGDVSTLPSGERWGFGYDVADVGDVNGDGYDDVLIGDAEWGDTHQKEGKAYLFLGSPAGLGPSAAWKVDGNESYLRLGVITAGAGDIDQDGRGDLLVGKNSTSSSTPPRVYLYRGVVPVPFTTPDWTAADAAGEPIGRAAAGAGDVNGDGFEDVVVGDWDYGTSGAVFVYYGSACVDLDGDQACAGADCDDTKPYCTFDCTDIDGDGRCVSFDCDDFRAECGTDCADDDHRLRLR